MDYKGYQLDTSSIQEQHHTNPRRLYSTTSADWQMRVDHERLRAERLAKARAEMEADDLGALVPRSAEHTSDPQTLMPISYAVFCLKKTTHSIPSSHTQHSLILMLHN